MMVISICFRMHTFIFVTDGIYLIKVISDVIEINMITSIRNQYIYSNSMHFK